MPLATAFLRIFTALVLSIPLFLSFGYYLGADAIQNTVLRPSYLIESFEHSSAYDRIYSEVLLTAEFEDWSGALTGNFAVSEEEKIALMHEIIPPEYVQGETERGFASLVSYLRNDSNSLDVFIDLTIPAENLKPVMFAFLDQKIDSLDRHNFNDPGNLSREVAGFLRSVSRGQIPEYVPTIEALNASDWKKVYLQAFDILYRDANFSESVKQSLRRNEAQIVDTVQVNDVTTALKTAARTVAEPRLGAAFNRLLRQADAQRQLDIIDSVARDSNRTRTQVIGDANILRTAFAFGTSEIARWVALGFLGLCTVAMASVFVPYWRHVFFWPSVFLLMSGAIFLIVGLMFVFDLPVWVEALCRDSNSPSCGLSADVARSVASGVGLDIVMPSLIVALIGGGGILVSIVVAAFAKRRA